MTVALPVLAACGVEACPLPTAVLSTHTGGFGAPHIADLTDHPSPNYLLVLQRSRKIAIEQSAGFLLVESDVVVDKGTLQGLFDGAMERTDCAIAASVTVDDNGKINYPYEYARGHEGECYAVKKHCSFCCSLLTPEFLARMNFDELDPTKHWYDVQISHKASELGFQNYLFANLPVVHRPHQSRPWKHLKYTNPLKYYWIKFTKGFDKI
jgi:GT2 family glycosyltransferase